MENKLKTIDFKGKPYVEVSERLRYFRENHGEFGLETEIVQLDDKVCVLKAIIKDKEGRIIATGLAREVNGSSFINKTSYVENAETSAWGRALGNFGIGIEGSVASALEVANAIENQKPKVSQPKKSIFQLAKEALKEAKTEARFDEAWGNIKKRKKEFAEEDWVEIEKIGDYEKGKHVRGKK